MTEVHTAPSCPDRVVITVTADGVEGHDLCSDCVHSIADALVQLAGLMRNTVVVPPSATWTCDLVEVEES